MLKNDQVQGQWHGIKQINSLNSNILKEKKKIISHDHLAAENGY